MTRDNDTELEDVVEYDSQTNTYRVRYDRDRFDGPSTAIVYGIAAATDTDPLSVRPLYESVDPDAIDALFGTHGARSTRDGECTITHAGYDITIRSDGEIAIRPVESEP